MLSVAASPGASVPEAAAGPLIAVCGVCGGAGASTLAYLIARSAASDPGGPVLVCDTGGPSGGLALYAGVHAPRSLGRVASAIAEHEPLAKGLFADGAPGLRVMASAPHLDATPDERGVARLLRDAREAHQLTVVDCGTLRAEADRQVLALATQQVWVLPATISGVKRAQRVLDLFVCDPSRGEVVVARHDPDGRKPPTEDLGALAAGRTAPLVLMPHVPDLAERPADEALDQAALSLDAIRAALSR